MTQELDFESPRVQNMMRNEQQIEPHTSLTSMQWYKRWTGLEICTGSQGTVLEFSRWFSSNQRWLELRPQYYVSMRCAWKLPR